MGKQNSLPYRSVLITGGTRGIGKACVYAFAKSGFRVAFAYRVSDKAARAIEQELQGEGYTVYGYACDISRASETEKLFLQTKKTIGRIDTLVNNAGITRRDLLTDETPESVDSVLRTNLTGMIHLCRLYAPDMIDAGFGRIINLSSVQARIGASCESVYAASKGGVDALTRSLAKEFGPSGITVNAVSPGLIDTEINHFLTVREKADFLKTAALGRIGTAPEVADTILFLASEKASYITGQVINIDGGL